MHHKEPTEKVSIQSQRINMIVVLVSFLLTLNRYLVTEQLSLLILIELFKMKNKDTETSSLLFLGYCDGVFTSNFRQLIWLSSKYLPVRSQQ